MGGAPVGDERAERRSDERLANEREKRSDAERDARERRESAFVAAREQEKALLERVKTEGRDRKRDREEIDPGRDQASDEVQRDAPETKYDRRDDRRPRRRDRSDGYRRDGNRLRRTGIGPERRFVRAQTKPLAAVAPLRLSSAARNSTRRILPDRVFGRSATNSISRGYLYGAVTRLQ